MNSKGFAWTLEGFSSFLALSALLVFFSNATFPLSHNLNAVELEKGLSFLDVANKFGSLKGITSGEARLRLSLAGFEGDREFFRSNLKRIVSGENNLLLARQLAGASTSIEFLESWCAETFPGKTCSLVLGTGQAFGSQPKGLIFTAYYWSNGSLEKAALSVN